MSLRDPKKYLYDIVNCSEFVLQLTGKMRGKMRVTSFFTILLRNPCFQTLPLGESWLLIIPLNFY